MKAKPKIRKIRAKNARPNLNRPAAVTAEIALMGKVFSSDPIGMMPKRVFGTLYTNLELKHIISALRKGKRSDTMNRWPYTEVSPGASMKSVTFSEPTVDTASEDWDLFML